LSPILVTHRILWITDVNKTWSRIRITTKCPKN